MGCSTWSNEKVNSSQDVAPELFCEGSNINGGNGSSSGSTKPVQTGEAATTTTSTTSSTTIGDITLDGRITAQDMVYLLRFLLNEDLDTNGININAGDVNQDNNINGIDIALYREYLCRTINAFPQ